MCEIMSLVLSEECKLFVNNVQMQVPVLVGSLFSSAAKDPFSDGVRDG